MGIKNVDVEVSKLLEDVETEMATITEVEEAAILSDGTEREKKLLGTLRKLRTSLRELKKASRNSNKNLTIEQLCGIIRDNLTNRSIRDACNVANTMYGPGFVEGLLPIERIKVCETILQFFDDNNTSPPLQYWRMVLNNNGSFDY